MPVDNFLYNTHAAGWWDENHFLHMLKSGINPARFGYFREILEGKGLLGKQLSVLDIGCGGGILSEDFASLGYKVSGVDLSHPSLLNAQRHASYCQLSIGYHLCSAEHLPFPTSAFDMILCCDVLEHLSDPEKVIAETVRLLKPGGILFFDTINRTLSSFFEHIFVAQDFAPTRFFPENTHSWSSFIRPTELNSIMANNGLTVKNISGLQPGVSKISTALAIFALKQKKINYAEFGSRLNFTVCQNISGSYIGYAQKDT